MRHCAPSATGGDSPKPTHSPAATRRCPARSVAALCGNVGRLGEGSSRIPGARGGGRKNVVATPSLPSQQAQALSNPWNRLERTKLATSSGKDNARRHDRINSSTRSGATSRPSAHASRATTSLLQFSSSSVEKCRFTLKQARSLVRRQLSAGHELAPITSYQAVYVYCASRPADANLARTTAGMSNIFLAYASCIDTETPSNQLRRPVQ